MRNEPEYTDIPADVTVHWLVDHAAGKHHSAPEGRAEGTLCPDCIDAQYDHILARQAEQRAQQQGSRRQNLLAFALLGGVLILAILGVGIGLWLVVTYPLQSLVLGSLVSGMAMGWSLRANYKPGT